MWIKNAVGGLCIAAGTLFLTINSVILARGAARWALSSWEAISYGAIAATVPWIIAVMPLLVAMSWKPGRRVGRPTAWTAVGCGIWLVFAVYNIMGAGGAISGVRSDVVSGRKHDATAQQSLAQRRTNLQNQLDAIPKGTRAEALLRPQIEGAKASPWWTYSEGCTDVSKPRERKFCAGYQALVSELGAAQQLAKLTTEIAALDEQFAAAGPTADVVDPEARFYARVTGWPETAVQEWLPMRTPIVLELGSMTLLGFAFQVFGWRHAGVLKTTALQPQVTVARQQTQGNVTQLSSQLELAVWFFRECMRRHAPGSLPETDWYKHYCELCARGNDMALPLAGFRRVAKNFVPSIKEVDGQHYYLGVLPLIQSEVA